MQLVLVKCTGIVLKRTMTMLNSYAASVAFRYAFIKTAHLDVFFSCFSIMEARRTMSYFQFLQGFRKLIFTAEIIYHISNSFQDSCSLFYKSRTLLGKDIKPTIVRKIALRCSLVFFLGNDRIQTFFL